MKKSYIFMVLGLMCIFATGCNRDEVLKSFKSFRVVESGFDDDNTKVHLILGSGSEYTRLAYDNGDAVLINGETFTLRKEATEWYADASDPVEAPVFYSIYGNGMNLSGTGPNYNYDITSLGATTGVILGGNTTENVLTLHPACAILVFPSNGTEYSFVKVGFDSEKVAKKGGLDVSGSTPILSANSSYYLAGVTSGGDGQFLNMVATDGDFSKYYVAVPIKNQAIITNLYFEWKAVGAAQSTKFKTSAPVELRQGRVYTIGKTRVSAFDNYGASKSYFSVGIDPIFEMPIEVRFSAGNLQYKPSDFTWRFAPNQYETSQYNADISYGCTNYVDLFGWGTSGKDLGDGSTSYVPWIKNTDDATYVRAASIASTTSDWGVFRFNGMGNPVSAEIMYGSSSAGSSWRTLTQSEWNYLISGRTNAASKYGWATIGGTYLGIILLPDGVTGGSWSYPGDIPAFVPGMGSGFATNQFTMDQWSKLELAGAIFLPCGGYRDNANVIQRNQYGYYWTATSTGNNSSGDYPNAIAFRFFNQMGNRTNTGNMARHMGCSVRLVKNR